MKMNLRIKSCEQQVCDFCHNPFYPAPQVLSPKTCGRPDCIRSYKRSIRNLDKLEALPIPTYHSILNKLCDLGMDKEWFLVYALGETGFLVSELLRIRPVDLYIDGAEKKILITKHSVPVVIWTPRCYQAISGTTAGVFERWAGRTCKDKWDKVFPYTKRAAQKMFQKAIRVSQVKGSWGTRSLRHMYGLTVARATDSEEAVAKALRLKDMASARIYLRISRELTQKGA